MSHRRGDGHLLTIARVHQSRFARIRTTNQRDKTTSEALRAIRSRSFLGVDTIKTGTLREQGIEFVVAQVLKGIELFNIRHENS
ncbi:unknown [Collinsella sp. CAG:289]|nr:unknown [Collinsella sp. CAG:289]